MSNTATALDAHSSHSSSSKSTKECPSKPSIAVTSTGSMVCRICQTNSVQESLISPCHCKGSMAYVHLTCLERWLNQASRSYCELCMYQFNSIQTKRYSFCQGLKLWIRHPRNRAHLQSDVLIGILLTIITIGLVSVCLLGFHYFVLEANKLGFSKIWTEVMLGAFLSVIALGYVVTIYLLVKDQVLPWWHWWKRTVDVKLLLTPSAARCVRRPSARETTV